MHHLSGRRSLLSSEARPRDAILSFHRPLYHGDDDPIGKSWVRVKMQASSKGIIGLRVSLSIPIML